MKKRLEPVQESPAQGRVLARFLAEDLRHIHAGKKETVIKATSTATYPEDGRKDITNIGADGDLSDV